MYKTKAIMPSEEQQQSIPPGLEALRQAEEYFRANPPQWPELTLTLTSSGCVVKGISNYLIPLPEQLKADTVNALLHELIEPAIEEARLLNACDFRYQVADDWDGPGQVVEVVLSAPPPIYERLQDKKLYATIISVMTTMVCENIGSDRLECEPVDPAI